MITRWDRVGKANQKTNWVQLVNIQTSASKNGRFQLCFIASKYQSTCAECDFFQVIIHVELRRKSVC